MAVIGKRPDPTPGDDEGFERVPDEDFARLPEDYSEWDAEEHPLRHFRTRFRPCYSAEELKKLEEGCLYMHAHMKRAEWKNTIGRRSDANDTPIKRPKHFLPSPGDEDYCPFEDARRRGCTIEELQEDYQLLYRNDSDALRDINEKIAKGLAVEKPTTERKTD